MLRTTSILAVMALASAVRAQVTEPAAPATQPAVPIAFERSPEEGLRGPVRFLAEIARREAELDLFQQLQKELYPILLNRYMLRPSSREIVRERDEARVALKAATERALALLLKDAAYQRAREAALAARAGQLAMRDTAALGSPELVAAAASATAAATDVNKLETQALASNRDVRAARDRLSKAEAAYAALTKEAETAATTDAEYKELAQAIEDTLADIDAAKQDLQTAMAAMSNNGEFADFELTELRNEYSRWCGGLVLKKLDRESRRRWLPMRLVSTSTFTGPPPAGQVVYRRYVFWIPK